MTSTSGLYSLLKVGALTFFGAFLAALTFTKIPESAAEWRALIFPCLATAIAAEVYFLRTQLSALIAQLAGQLPSPPAPGTTTTTVAQQTVTTPDAKPHGFVDVRALGALSGVVLAMAVLWGCGLFSVIEPSAVDCSTRILNDAAKGMTVVQIVEDVGGPCALDAAAVMAALMASKDPKVTSSPAYTETLRARAALVEAPVK